MSIDDRIDALARQLSNWGRWGPDDEVGTLNLITPEKRLQAAECVRSGSVLSLALELRSDLPQPPGSGRLNPQHLMTETPADAPPGSVPGYADDVLAMSVHASTHWDALSHIHHRGLMYNGRPSSYVTRAGARANSIVPVAGRLVTRCVLVDVARHHGSVALAPDHEVTVADLEATLEAQRVDLTPGDVLLVRTGQLGGSPRRATGATSPRSGPGCRSSPASAPPPCRGSTRWAWRPSRATTGRSSTSTPAASTASRSTRSASSTWGCRWARSSSSTRWPLHARPTAATISCSRPARCRSAAVSAAPVESARDQMSRPSRPLPGRAPRASRAGIAAPGVGATQTVLADDGENQLEQPGGRWFAQTARVIPSTKFRPARRIVTPRRSPGDRPRTILLRIAGRLIGETGFEPATARPPAGTIQLRGAYPAA